MEINMEITNTDRANWAQAAIQFFTDFHYFFPVDRDPTDADTVGQNVSDFLADLLHWLGPDRLEELLIRGRAHYDEEVAEEEQGAVGGG